MRIFPIWRCRRGPDQPIRLAFARGDQHRVAPSITVLVDPFSRRIVSVIDPSDFNAGETWLAWQRAMHAGAGLGPVWKALVFLVGLLPL